MTPQEQDWDSLPTIEVVGKDNIDSLPTVEVVPQKRPMVGPLPAKKSKGEQAIQSRMAGLSGAGQMATKVIPRMAEQLWEGGPGQVVSGIKQAIHPGKKTGMTGGEMLHEFVHGGREGVKDILKTVTEPVKGFAKDPYKQVTEDPMGTAVVASILGGGVASLGRRAISGFRTGRPLRGLGEQLPLTTEQKMVAAIKGAKPIRAEQEALYTKERGQRFAKAKQVGLETTGEAGFSAEKRPLGGELPKTKYEGVRGLFSQEEIDGMFETVKKHPRLTYTDTLTARDGLVKLFGEQGFTVPTEGELLMLNKVFPELTKAIMKKRPLWQRVKAEIFEGLNVPRAIMATLDLSAPFRQGVFLIGRKEFYNSFASMFKYFKRETAYQSLLDSIAKHPEYGLARKSKLALTELDVPMTMREEVIMSRLPEKIPVIGKLVRGSNRAYTGFLNKLRMDTFSSLVKDAERLGLKPRENPNLTSDIANFVNAASGRGTLWGMERHAQGLNALFFSPRLMGSRLNLLNPVYYIKLEPFVRKQALKSLLTFASAGMTTLGLAKLFGAEVGANPFSADFGKVKMGNTRLDTWGGFQQYVRTAAQLLGGKSVSPTTGKTTKLGEKYGAPTRKDVLLRFAEYKSAPVFSFAMALLEGKDPSGKPFKLSKELSNRFIPMIIQDMIDISKDDPELIPMTIFGAFGMGLQTYGTNPPKTTRKEKW